MSVLGVSVRVQSKKFVVGLAVVYGSEIVTSSHLSAPSSDDAISLGELYRMTHDIIGSYEPEKVAMLNYQNQSGKTLGIARRAEGAVLAAAGHRDCPVVEWGTVGALRKPLRLAGTASNPKTYEEAISKIAGAEAVETETGYAAAAALAALVA